jgi:hypothetical protein
MEEKTSNRPKGDNIRRYVLVGLLLLLALDHGIHAWQGHSIAHAVKAAVCIAAVVFLVRHRTKEV